MNHQRSTSLANLIFVLPLFACIASAPINLALAQTAPTSSQCQVSVTANQVIITNHERVETGFHVLPAGVIPEPNQWPFFARPAPIRGALRDRHGCWVRDAMDALASPDE